MATWLETIEEELSLLPVDGCISRDSVRTWYRFNEYIVNLLDPLGIVWRGYTVKGQGQLTLLVMKVAIDDIPQVAFVTGRTPTDCMSIFLAQLEDRRVAWRPDKYA